MNPTDNAPDTVSDEVLAWLEGQCYRMAATVSGLDEEELRARPLPSGWSMLGLLDHVRDSTHFWLHHVLAGHPHPMGDDEWDNDPEAPGSEVIERFTTSYIADIVAVRRLGLAADEPPRWWPDGAWGGYRQETVLGVLLHLFADNAAHAGQLSIVRELADGGVWDYAIGGIRVP